MAAVSVRIPPKNRIYRSAFILFKFNTEHKILECYISFSVMHLHYTYTNLEVDAVHWHSKVRRKVPLYCLLALQAALEKNNKHISQIWKKEE